MKTKINNKILLFFAVLLALGSCKKSFWTDTNKNPQAPASVPPSLLVPTVQASLGYTQGGDISRFTSLLTQQVFGNASQSQQYYIYQLNPGTFDNLWPDYYTSVLENNDTLMNLSDANGYHVYSGISRIMMAYSLQVGVDLWGALPYSSALKGNGNLHPSYDTDKGLYDTIANLVTTGITLLNDADPGVLTPGADDIVYGGKASKWIKFGHAILARIYFHQSKGNAAMAAKALQEISNSFTSNSDNAQFRFGTSETSANPWYQFNEQRPGDEKFANSPLAISMKANADPRYDIFFDPANDGKSSQVSGHYGGLNDYYGSINSPVEFITYDELQFMSAEAVLRNGGTFVAAQAFLTQAIDSNMNKLGVSAAAANTYKAAHGILPTTSVDAAIAKIASEAYVALYLNPEVWSTWRRTAAPTLTPISGGQVPRRLLYPQSEYSYNGANTPTGVTLFTPTIFWDK